MIAALAWVCLLSIRLPADRSGIADSTLNGVTGRIDHQGKSLGATAVDWGTGRGSRSGIIARSNGHDHGIDGPHGTYGYQYQSVEHVNPCCLLAAGHHNMQASGNANTYHGHGKARQNIAWEEPDAMVHVWGGLAAGQDEDGLPWWLLAADREASDGIGAALVLVPFPVGVVHRVRWRDVDRWAHGGVEGLWLVFSPLEASEQMPPPNDHLYPFRYVRLTESMAEQGVTLNEDPASQMLLSTRDWAAPERTVFVARHLDGEDSVLTVSWYGSWSFRLHAWGCHDRLPPDPEWLGLYIEGAVVEVQVAREGGEQRRRKFDRRHLGGKLPRVQAGSTGQERSVQVRRPWMTAR